MEDGPSDRIRTCGILLPKQARYQLRYTRLFSFLSGWSYSPKCGAVPAPLYPVDSAVGDSPSIPHSGRDFKTFYRVPDHGPGMTVSTKEKAPSSQMVLFGAGDEARTRYLDLGKVALYQMSYARIWRRYSSTMVPPVGVEPTTRGFSVRCSTN